MKTTFETIHPPVPPYRVPVNSPVAAARRPGLFQNSSIRAAMRRLAAVRSALKSFDFKQSFVDVLAVLALFLLVSVTGVGIAAGLFILIFVSL